MHGCRLNKISFTQSSYYYIYYHEYKHSQGDRLWQTATTWTGSSKRMVGQASRRLSRVLSRTLRGQWTNMGISSRIHRNTNENWTLSASSLYISSGIRKHTEGRQCHLTAWQDANHPDRRAQRRSRGAPRGQSSRSLLPKIDVCYRLRGQTRPRCTPTEYINLKTATNLCRIT